jgi:hypothetical protein
VLEGGEGMSIEAMKQALEALDSKYIVNCGAWVVQRTNAMTALRQAIEQAEQWDTSDMAYRPNGLSVEQEPVAWMVRDSIDGSWYPCAFENPAGAIKGESKPLYAAPPSKEWVGLTEEEIDEIYKQNHNQYGEDTTGEYERELEAKLRERNT